MLSLSRPSAVAVALVTVLAAFLGVQPVLGAVTGDDMVAEVRSTAIRDTATRRSTPPTPDVDVVRLTNAARAAAGLGPVTIDAALADIAAAHSADQAAMGRISHEGSDGSQVWDRLTRAGIAWGACGENVAYGHPSAASVVEGWMNSSGHRQNMLGGYTRIGVGIARDANGLLVWTMVLAA